MNRFNYYETVGVIAPGIVLIFTSSLIWPEQLSQIKTFDLSLGSFGFALILAYVAGHILQSVGNLIEKVWWKFSVYPSDSILDKECTIVNQQQKKQIEERLRKIYPEFLFSDQTNDSWGPFFRQVHNEVSKAGNTARIDAFNGTYGMLRGVAVATFVSAIVMIFVRGFCEWQLILVLIFAGILSLIRMARFGRYYAREVFLEYIIMRNNKEE